MKCTIFILMTLSFYHLRLSAIRCYVWLQHDNDVTCHKINASLWTGRICIIYKIQRLIDTDTCAYIVRALILSHLDYCNLLFNDITQKNLVRLQKLQNKCARLVNMQPRSSHITPLLMDLHWLCVSERIIFKTLLYVFKSLNGLCPQYMNDCLVVETSPWLSYHPLWSWPEPPGSKNTQVPWRQSLFSGCSTVVE